MAPQASVLITTVCSSKVRAERSCFRSLTGIGKETNLRCLPNPDKGIIVPRKLGFSGCSAWLLDTNKTVEIMSNYLHYYFAYRASRPASLRWAVRSPTSGGAQARSFPTLHNLNAAHVWQLDAGLSGYPRDKCSRTRSLLHLYSHANPRMPRYVPSLKS